ncbi:MAG: D-tyrosyl-tRNA(Tyr) deacylase [Thermoanaerobaculia bacterium]|nr:MAG: D-tyrosyl-tRNA(Tyr) deacylase [Thermoanaerobaculia bacterium]
MRLILQRVARASVTVAGERVAAIGRGLLVLAGVERGDGAAQAAAAADKIARLRIFGDAEGKMNLDLAQAGGAVLLVSQFTLAASTDRGRRPSFERAAPAGEARQLLEVLAAELRRAGLEVETGRFAARMEVELINDGPVTLVLDFPSSPGQS